MAQESKSKKGKQPAAKGLLRDGPNWPLFILAALGMALSGYLTFTAWQGRLTAFCAEGAGCDVVLTAPMRRCSPCRHHFGVSHLWLARRGGMGPCRRISGAGLGSFQSRVCFSVLI
jgi:hypothetical protein